MKSSCDGVSEAAWFWENVISMVLINFCFKFFMLCGEIDLGALRSPRRLMLFTADPFELYLAVTLFLICASRAGELFFTGMILEILPSVCVLDSFMSESKLGI